MTSSKSNIKHETLDTKILDTRYEIRNNKSIEFAHASAEALETKFFTASPTSQARLSGERPLGSVAQRESGNVIAPALQNSDFVYACLSLHHVKRSKKHGTEETESRRRKVNLDFRIKDTPSHKFNKLKFTLTWKPSEFLKNIPVSSQHHRSYTRSMAIYQDIKEQTDRVWIGKGNLRQYFDGGPRTIIKENTSMVLYDHDNTIGGYLWIEDAEIEFEFDTLIDNKYYFMKCEPIKVLDVSWAKTGGWL